MRMLVTGGAGFIGSNLIRMASADSAVGNIKVLDDLSTGTPGNLQDLDVQVIEGSLLDHASLEQAVEKVDTVVHLAAVPSVPRSIKDPLCTHQANVTGTLLLLEACRRHGVQHVAVASSSSVYGSNPALPKGERDWVRPLSPYAVSKLATEQYALAYQTSFALPTLAFRFFNVYGPGQRAGHAYAAVVPTFLDALLHDRPLSIHGDGTQSRDFTYVGTVCRILLDAAKRRVTHPEPVNLAYGTRTSLLDLIVTLGGLTGLMAKREHTAPRAGDVPHSQADNCSLRELFPDVQATTLEDGLAATVDWFRTLA